MMASALLFSLLFLTTESGVGPVPGDRMAILLGESRKVLDGAPPESLTLQIETDCEEASVFLTISLSGGRIPIWILPAEVKGRRCFRVVTGVFGSEPEAREARSKLPEPFASRKEQPRILKISTIVRPGSFRSPARDTEIAPAGRSQPDPIPSPAVREPPSPRSHTPTIVRAAPIVSPAVPVALEAPVPEPTAVQPPMHEIPAHPATAAPQPIPMRAEPPNPNVSLPPHRTGPAPAAAPPPGAEPLLPLIGRAAVSSTQEQSLQDFAKQVSFQKRSNKGSFSVSESETRIGEPRSSLRVTTLTQDPADRDGQILVNGLVKNSGNGAACNIQLQVKIFGLKGELLGASKTLAAQERLNPGESTPFQGAVFVSGAGDPPGTRTISVGRAQVQVSDSKECP